MSCSCGSAECVCEHGCYCQVYCTCKKCLFLEKRCPRCNLPLYVNTNEDIQRQACCCPDHAFNFYTDKSNRQTSAAAKGNQLSAASVRRDVCLQCDRPVLNAATAEGYDCGDQYCCCSNRNSSTSYPDELTEHETSNGTSDNRNIRFVRKLLSRQTRTETAELETKKFREQSSNSADDFNNTETGYPHETSSSATLMDNDEQNTSCSSPFGDMRTAQNFNRDSNTQSPAGNTSKADESSTGNVSLLVNTSGAASPVTSNSFRPYLPSPFPRMPNIILGTLANTSGAPTPGTSTPGTSNSFQPNLPSPFPRMPNILGTPAFFKHLGRMSQLQFKRWTALQEHQQPAARREVKLEKWFGTLRDEIKTSGELPDARAAADLVCREKKQMGMEVDEHSRDQPEFRPSEDYPRDPLYPRQTSRQISLEDQNKGEDDIDSTTDTYRSTSLSKSRKESESD